MAGFTPSPAPHANQNVMTTVEIGDSVFVIAIKPRQIKIISVVVLKYEELIILTYTSTHSYVF